MGTNTINTIREYDNQLPENIYAKKSHLERVRMETVELITGGLKAVGDTVDIMCSIVMITNETQEIKYNNEKEEDIEMVKENKQYLTIEGSRGFRNYSSEILKNALDIVNTGNSLAKDIVTKSFQNVETYSGMHETSSRVTGFLINGLQKINTMTDIVRQKRHLPVIKEVVVEITKLSQNEYLLSLKGLPKDSYFADYNNKLVRPIFKIVIRGNRCIYYYVTTLIDNSNPSKKEEFYGMTPYYILNQETWLPWEPYSYSQSSGVYSLEFLLYPIKLNKLFKIIKSKNMDTLSTSFWKTCIQNFIKHSNKKNEISLLNKNQENIIKLENILNGKILNIDLNLVDACKKKSLPKIFDSQEMEYLHSATVKDAEYIKNLKNMHYNLFKDILESIYTEGKENLFDLLKKNIFDYIISYKDKSLIQTLQSIGSQPNKIKENLSTEKIKKIFSSKFLNPFPVTTAYNEEFEKVLLINESIIAIIFINNTNDKNVELFNLFDENPVFDIILNNEDNTILFQLKNNQPEKYTISQNIDLKMLNYQFLLYKKYQELNKKKSTFKIDPEKKKSSSWFSFSSKKSPKEEIYRDEEKKEKQYNDDALKIKNFFYLLSELSTI